MILILRAVLKSTKPGKIMIMSPLKNIFRLTWLKQYLLILVVGVAMVLLIVAALKYTQRNFINYDQAQQIARRVATERCAAAKTTSCNNLKLTDSEKSSAGPTDSGPDFYNFAYETTQGPSFDTVVHLDLAGKVYSENEYLQSL